jgi:hypothetical protein
MERIDSMLLVCNSSYGKSILRYKSFSTIPLNRTLNIYVRNYVRIRGYFLKLKGVGEQKSMENPVLGGLFHDAVNS